MQVLSSDAMFAKHRHAVITEHHSLLSAGGLEQSRTGHKSHFRITYEHHWFSFVVVRVPASAASSTDSEVVVVEMKMSHPAVMSRSRRCDGQSARHVSVNNTHHSSESDS